MDPDQPGGGRPRRLSLELADEVRSALRVMRHIAHELGHDGVETDHLLIAVLREAPRTLDAICDAAELEAIAVDMMPPGHRDGPRDLFDLPWTTRTKEALELAMWEAFDQGDREVRPLHVLVGILTEGEGRGAAALRAKGIVDAAALRSTR